MRKPDTPFTGWTRETGYPKASRSSGALTVTDRFYCDAASFDFDQLEALESLEFMGQPLLSSNAEPSVDGSKIFVAMTYGPPSASGGSLARDGVTEFTLEDSGTELPIGKRNTAEELIFPDYRACHNYKLAANEGVTETPEWWDQTHDTIMTEEEAASYRWVKDTNELPGPKWHIIEEATKGIETVMVSAPVVVETRRYQNYNQACAAKKPFGKRITPAKTFNEPGEWLVMGSTISQDGRRWVCTTRYQSSSPAATWDHDYYAAPA